MKMNCIYVARDDEGKAILYGAHKDGRDLTVFLDTKDVPNLCKRIYNPKYFGNITEERVRQKLNEHPTHNFVGNLGKCLLSMPAKFATVVFS